MPDVNLPLTDEAVASLNEEMGITDISQSLQEEIDALGSAKTAYSEAKARVAAYENRMKMLLESLEQHAKGEHALRARGTHYEAEITEPTKTRFVSNIQEVVKILGAKLFLQHCSFNVGDVTALVPLEKQASVIGFKTGKRKLNISKL